MEEEVVLVIRPIHNAQRQAYEYKPVEVPAHTAEDQLSKKDDQRNHHWKGVRYATEEERDLFYPKPAKVSKQAEPELAEVEETKGKPGRKSKNKEE
jgi:hypothetical protein